MQTSARQVIVKLLELAEHSSSDTSAVSVTGHFTYVSSFCFPLSLLIGPCCDFYLVLGVPAETLFPHADTSSAAIYLMNICLCKP